MGMIFCRGCGKEIHESAQTCPHCGAPQNIANSTSDTIPDGIKGWSWGAFLLNWIWAIGNKTWIGLLALIPYVGFIMAIVLGFKGREWAWKNKQWDSVEHFNRVQRKWSAWGLGIIGVCFVVGILAAIAIPAYHDYQQKALAAKAAQEEAKAQQEAQAQQETQIKAQQAAEQLKAQQLAAVPWLDDLKKEFINQCVQGAGPQASAELASTYCACVANKLSVKVAISQISQSADAMNQAKAECLPTSPQ